MELNNTSYVQIVGTTINVNANSLAEIKLALKELKLKCVGRVSDSVTRHTPSIT